MTTQSKKELIVKYTPEGERIEISPYIWGVMHGEPPLYLEDEEQAIEIAKKLGRKGDPRWHPTVKPVSDETAVENEQFLRECGMDMDEWHRIMKKGGGEMPGWHATQKKTN